MKKLYLKLYELLSEIPEIKYIDLNFGQILEEKPPLLYPAILIGINITSTDDFHDVFQQNNAEFTLTLIDKAGETNSLFSEEKRIKNTAYLDLSEKIYRKLQGYEGEGFDAFSRKSATEQNLRRGLRIVAERYATGWKTDFANS